LRLSRRSPCLSERAQEIITVVIGRVSSPRFVGRREELAVLEAALQRAEAGAGAVVLIGAEAGMGKSRLVAELRQRADTSGACAAVGECLPLGQGELPYAPIVGALRSLLRQRAGRLPDGIVHDELARLLPELAGPAPAASPEAVGAPGLSGAAGTTSRLFEQLLDVFTTLARDAPVVLAIEDVHWSDPSTRDFLTFLVRGTRHESLALVLTYRSDEVGRGHPARPFLTELERSGQALRVELRGFQRAELREQVREILGRDPTPRLLDNLLRRAQGNPFFTEELLAIVEDQDAPLPESLREAMLSRIDGSPDPVRAVLRVAAVAGREVDHALLSAVTSLDGAVLIDAVRDAVRSHLLVEAASGYGFRHALLREAVYGDLLAEERRALHLELARVLSGAPEGTGAELAHH
jgi:predicted ATPase